MALFWPASRAIVHCSVKCLTASVWVTVKWPCAYSLQSHYRWVGWPEANLLMLVGQILLLNACSFAKPCSVLFVISLCSLWDDQACGFSCHCHFICKPPTCMLQRDRKMRSGQRYVCETNLSDSFCEWVSQIRTRKLWPLTSEPHGLIGSWLFLLECLSDVPPFAQNTHDLRNHMINAVYLWTESYKYI